MEILPIVMRGQKNFIILTSGIRILLRQKNGFVSRFVRRGKEFVLLALERQGADLKRGDFTNTFKKGQEGSSYWYYGPK